MYDKFKKYLYNEDNKTIPENNLKNENNINHIINTNIEKEKEMICD